MIDSWFNQISRSHLLGKAEMVRYSDDMVFIFERRDDAKRLYEALPKRLNKYGLMLHTEKSQLIVSGQYAAKKAEQADKRLPTYNFLGFTCYWGKARNGHWRLKFTSRRDRFTAKLKGLREYLRKQLNTKDTMGVLKIVVQVLRGWINYHGISDNERRVKSFIYISKNIVRRWFNRRGRKRPKSWQVINQILKRVNFPERWKTVSMFYYS